jgi:2'-5' RNA ligase
LVTGGQNVRLFLAGAPPHGLQSTIFEALKGERRAASQARWVRPGQLHLTLAFFGEMDAREVTSLVESLGPLGLRHSPTCLELKGAGCFGRPHAPSVLFAELEGDVAGLRALAADVRAVVGTPSVGGQTPAEAFHPHLTLARARSRQGDAALSCCQRALRQRALGAFVLERMVLCQSQLLPTGSLYTELAHFPLVAPAEGPPAGLASLPGGEAA